jgi:hypothetical protein
VDSLAPKDGMFIANISIHFSSVGAYMYEDCIVLTDTIGAVFIATIGAVYL